MEYIKRLPLQALKYFYYFGSCGSLQAAADTLCLTHGALSKQLKLLEQAVGVPLLIKQGRQLVLTEAGSRLWAACRSAFAGLNETVAALAAPHRLVLSCEPTIAMKWLIPRLPRFQLACPETELVIYAAGGAVDFARGQVDAALRRNDFAWPPDLPAEYIAAERTGLLWRQPGATVYLTSRSRPQAYADWLRAAALQAPPQFEHSRAFEHFYLCIQAACAGVGATVASSWTVEEELAAGLLQAPYGFVPDGSAYYLLSAKGFAEGSPQARLLAWLRSEMAEQEA